MNTIAQITDSYDNTKHTLQVEKFQVIPHSADNSLVIQQGIRQWQVDFTLQPSDEMLITGLYGALDSNRQASQLMDQLFAYSKSAKLVISNDLLTDRPELHMSHWRNVKGGLAIDRAAFYQIREHWLAPEVLSVAPDVRVEVEGVSEPVPVRPQTPDTILYQRFIPELNEVFSLRRASVEEDGERFHRWQNEPRIAEFWEYALSREELDDMLRDRLSDPHCEPLIACFDGVPFGYVETYWALEDRLGPYYDARPFDHGFHVLVGEVNYLGRGRTAHWINAITHYLLLLDPRTDRIMGEPRADNTRILKWIEHTAWYKEREFDFPHKRAALLKCEKHDFFQSTVL
ncbi:GNAT family N-acetyltransferase [Hahella ganghwensis]|uniref:GNAT family N-acetyltransferase n=1 Tax=Hahella ganghwensis TaxID=286420 RepID=UPI000375DD63|nr:GNAT family N-acetyltransferase [Hahella ganghwensis]